MAGRLGIHGRLHFLLEVRHALLEFHDALTKRAGNRWQPATEKDHGNDAKDYELGRTDSEHDFATPARNSSRLIRTTHAKRLQAFRTLFCPQTGLPAP